MRREFAATDVASGACSKREMQTVAIELMSKLRDIVEALRDHLSRLDELNLRVLEARLPRNSLPGGPLVSGFY